MGVGVRHPFRRQPLVTAALEIFSLLAVWSFELNTSLAGRHELIFSRAVRNNGKWLNRVWRHSFALKIAVGYEGNG